MNWHAHVTVATVIEKDGKFLMVEEVINGARVINQPAGHLEENESIYEAAVRETLEETQWVVKLDYIIGFTLFKSPDNGITYFRTTFAAHPIEINRSQTLDKDIERAVWLSKEDLHSGSLTMRSAMVLGDIERFLRGDRLPLESVGHINVP